MPHGQAAVLCRHKGTRLACVRLSRCNFDEAHAEEAAYSDNELTDRRERCALRSQWANLNGRIRKASCDRGFDGFTAMWGLLPQSASCVCYRSAISSRFCFPQRCNGCFARPVEVAVVQLS
mmetsp:Transcript_3038/g.7264  ORF Transcript_3038/g.7264 Transcript_3038/m.7264 type:complete len:121 (+) Transcript_3038:457-819(+)